jgi:hypothetical protein
MNAFVDLFDQTLESRLREVSGCEVETRTTEDERPEIDRFEAEQIRGLVRRVFLPGPSRPVQQVVFAPVDEDTQIDFLCRRVAETLAEQVSGAVWLMGAAAAAPPGEDTSADRDFHSGRAIGLKDFSKQLSHNLWNAPSSVILSENGRHVSPHSLAARMEGLSLEFDYAVLQAPAASVSGMAELLGQLCDGLVLVLRADSTRRAVAKSTQERLSAARVKILGTVLTERSFPIPEALYRRL